jgi:hypothetical protein
MSICSPSALSTILLFVAAFPTSVAQDKDSTSLDLTGKSLPADWHLTAKSHQLANGELVADGGGSLEWAQALQDKATIALTVLTEEKANVEVHLVDDKGRSRYAFAFLGQYHQVLERVAVAILRDDRFVASNPKLWLYPGRKFELEVRRAKGQFQMFVNGELGAVFVDDKAVDGKDLKLRICWATEGGKDKVHLQGVKVALPR